MKTKVQCGKNAMNVLNNVCSYKKLFYAKVGKLNEKAFY